MQRSQSETVTLNDILITEELSRRAPRSANLQTENQAMRSLAQQMARDSKSLMQMLADTALELCHAGTAGVSLLETTPNGTEIFRWTVLAGTLAQYVGGTVPRNFSPCGVCLDRATPVLFSHPESYFTYFQEANTPVVEGLVLPLVADDHVLGTIWIMSHDEARQFDSEDVRVMTSLADFTATALLLNQRQTRELLAANAMLEAEIAERKQTEAQLSETQRRLQLSLTGANLGTWTYRVGTDEFWADDRAQQMHGHEPDEVHTFAQAGENIHPEDRDHAQATIAQAIQDRSKLQLEYRVIWRDGSIHWIASYAEFIFTGEQDQGMFYGVAQDITEAKRDEGKRKRREADLAFLAQIAEDSSRLASEEAIMKSIGERLATHLRLDGFNFSYVDEQHESVTIKYSWNAAGVPQLLGTFRFAEYMTEEFTHTMRAGETWVVCDTQHDERTDAQATAAIGVAAVIIVPYHRQGEWQGCLTVTCREVREWTADEIALIVEVSNRTFPRLERARAEAALRESEQRLSVIFAQSAVGLSEISLDGHFLQFNEALCQMLGRSRSELLAATVPDVTHPDDISSSLAALARLIETGEPVSLDKRYLRSDGTVLWANSILTLLNNEQGQPQYVLAVTVDLSDRKKAEADQNRLMQEQAARQQERQRAETLAELDRAKTLFFTNISHEFRTPLTLSLAPLQDALRDRAHPLDPIHRERLQLVHRNSLRLLKLVNTLLDFSRIEAGRMEAVYEPTDLSTFTAELASVFRSAIERAGLQLIVDCPPLPEPVFVDREMWEKIVLNLLSNAFKFTFIGEVRASLHSTDGNQAILQIQDTGTGIAPEHLPHLFERFYQVRGSQARTHEGSGIGLALVHELVRLHGGTIEVSSTVGEGTCFAIALPFGTDHLPQERIHTDRTQTSTAIDATLYVEEAERWLPPQVSEVSKTSEISPAAARVLLVDDNADMREYLTHILSEYVQVEAVADGATALAVAQEQPPDLILSDVMMPGLDGFELLEALRANPQTREVPIILLSARAGEEAIVEGLEAGAGDYLIKPFSAQELISRITAHLQMVQLRREALQEARSTLRSRDEFISVVSHELNTPLVSILGWTRMLRSSPPNPVMLGKALDTIERNATLQGKLVQDLLDLSRISAGKLRLNPQPIELKPVMETAIATVAQTAADKGIDLTWQETVREPVVVMGDGDRLGQVICNLLTNAIKFTPESGRVGVKLSVRSDDSSADVSYAEIRVTDTGDGIPADFLPYVFDRFRQAESANSAKGLGLGLTISRHIVELHNGTIHADSAEEGRGATFIVRLPLLQHKE